MPHKVRLDLLDDVTITSPASGDVVNYNGTKWVNSPGSGLFVPASTLTTKGDLLTRTATVYARQGVGSDGQVLTSDSAQTNGIKWATPSSGATSPLTTKGDVWGYSSLDARVPIGANGEVLTADSAQTLGLKWASIGGIGSPGASTEAIGHASGDAAPGSPDSTNDEFTDTDLTPWTASNPGTNPGVFVKRYGRLWYRHQNTAGSGNPNIAALLKSRSMSVGDYIETCIHRVGTSNYTGLGLIMADGTSQGAGKQITAFVYNDGERLTMRGMNNFNADQGALQTEILVNYNYYTGMPIFVRLKYTASNQFGLYWSPDGFEWKSIGASSFTMTPSYVGVCTIFYGAVAAPGGWFNWHYFRTNPGDEA